MARDPARLVGVVAHPMIWLVAALALAILSAVVLVGIALCRAASDADDDRADILLQWEPASRRRREAPPESTTRRHWE